MKYTVSDFYHTFYDHLTLLAGEGGLSNVIKKPGILDYEMEPDVKDRFFYINSFDDELVVTSFLYAKDNPYLISDGIKHLIDQKAAGLVIKNVFNLPIHESVLRYADRKNFPVFFVETRDVYIEKIIFEVSLKVKLMEQVNFGTESIDRLLLSGKQIPVRYFLPSVTDEYFVLYIKAANPFDAKDFLRVLDSYEESRLYRPTHGLFYWKEGIFFVFSGNNARETFEDDHFFRYLPEVLNFPARSSYGLSGFHRTLKQGKQAFSEALYAAFLSEDGAFLRYDDLGSYKIVLPLANTVEMSSFSEEILNPLWDYDIINKSNLAETLEVYLKAGGDFKVAAKEMGQHFNTIRYRMEQIKELTGLDYRNPEELEQLSLAIKIQKARNFHI